MAKYVINDGSHIPEDNTKKTYDFVGLALQESKINKNNYVTQLVDQGAINTIPKPSNTLYD